MKQNVLITGGTGFIGKKLTKILLERGYSVSILTRNSKPNTEGVTYYIWDVTSQNIEEAAVAKADYIIHLAGENIAEKKWTAKRKAEIRESRTQSAQLIYSVLKKYNKRIEAFVSASGIGFYGAINGEGICTENTLPANDFIGTTCQEWEKSADLMAGLGIRTVKIRTGLVLGKDEGILKKLTPIFKRRLGSALGSGKQYMPWIHIQDLCMMYIEAIENEKMTGAYNATINDSTTNLIFSKALASSLGYSIWLPNVPAFLIRLGMGEMAAIVLTGRRVSSDKIKSLGFRFQFRNLKSALKDCLK
ncbi:TIGR01777 family oxidoreductase [Flavobacterium taihuense]|uniref:TIGR01777 family oxidoreductase n=1 Tax=Flavobacterium taihuense TaxID=2857508 RepID=A0ABS6XZN7_9FLAO|nr:TIGR01777 family oxidoreductase [Flavobacterium taihuense]MBW4361278.1 TIGR01777 family oxidoreductase [Flavobacterium taihuense]